MWNGKQLLNRAWMERMTSNLVDSSGGEVYSDGNDWGVGYGYQIWQCIPKGVYRGDGAYGQFAIVAPEKDLVIATLTGTEDMSGLMAEMWKHLLPARADVDIAPDSDGTSKKSSLRLRFRKGMISKARKIKSGFPVSWERICSKKMRSSWKDTGGSGKDGRYRCDHLCVERWKRADTFLWIPPLGVQ